MRDQLKPGRLVSGVLLLALMAFAGAAAATRDVRIVEAAKNQDRHAVSALLNQHADPNVRSEDGSTAILWAAHWNDLDTASLLIQSGANVNAANDFQLTPLSAACTNGSAALVDLLLKAGANPNTRIATGETPLMTCASSGNAAAVRMLLVRGADVNASEPAQNQTALMWATAENHPQVVRTLIEARADVTARTQKGFTPLHFAARQGDLESVRLLLAAGVDVNILSQPEIAEKGRAAGAGYSRAGLPAAYIATLSAGSTPLLVATVRSQVPLALFLLENGADPNIGDAGFTPLHWVVGSWESDTGGVGDRVSQLQLVKALLAHGAKPDVRITPRQVPFAGGFSDTLGATPFILASSASDMELMKILLDAGADPKLVTKAGTSALLAAAGLNRGTGQKVTTESQAFQTVKFLLDLGLDPLAITTRNENALFGPAYHGWNTILEFLIEKGADVNIVSKAGITPWLAASGLGDRLGGVVFNTDGAALLEKHGANPKLGKPCQAQNRCR